MSAITIKEFKKIATEDLKENYGLDVEAQHLDKTQLSLLRDDLNVLLAPDTEAQSAVADSLRHILEARGTNGPTL